jgi:uncharacterized protein HemY
MSEKKLRDSLAELVDMLDRAGYVSTQEWLDGEERARKALAEAGEPEMVQLLRWVIEQRRKCLHREKESVHYSWDKAIKFGHYAEAFSLVRKELEHTFGYTLPEVGE